MQFSRFAEPVRRGCTRCNIEIRIWAPRCCAVSALLPRSAVWPRYRLPYAAVSRYAAPRVSRRDVSRGAALDNQRRGQAALRPAHVPVRLGAGQKNNSAIVNFTYETMHPKRIKPSPVQLQLEGTPQRKIGFSPQLPLWGHPALLSKCI